MKTYKQHVGLIGLCVTGKRGDPHHSLVQKSVAATFDSIIEDPFFLAHGIKLAEKRWAKIKKRLPKK